MSYFLITNNEDKAKHAERMWGSLFDNANTAKLGDKIYITLTSGFKKKILKKETGGGYVFAFGTFFTREGFGENALKNIVDYDSYKKQKQSGLFGHYIFVFVNEEGAKVVNDEVGMLNVYYAETESGLFISNDLAGICRVSGKSKLCRIGVKQFISKESSIGRYTIFDHIKRMTNGRYLELAEVITEKKAHAPRPEKLTLQAYLERISYYFKLIDLYEGRIAVDISAGFDTRLVASSAYQLIENLTANTNSNKFDGGIDDAVSPVVAEKLGLALYKIEDKNSKKNNTAIMLHGFSVGRDIFRSERWISRLEAKYNYCDLVLGGYGGEGLRAQYNANRTLSEVAKYYYLGDKVKPYFNELNYLKAETEELALYDGDKVLDKRQLGNWIYILDRMRIWGGSQVGMSSLYGDILHPYMDWYLISPIFSMNPRELKGGKLQRKIIEYFAPQLKSIPVNEVHKSSFDAVFKALKKILVLNLMHTTVLKKYVKYILSAYKRRSNRVKIKGFYRVFDRTNFDEYFLTETGVNLELLEKNGEIEMLMRLATVKVAKEYCLTEFSDSPVS